VSNNDPTAPQWTPEELVRLVVLGATKLDTFEGDMAYLRGLSVALLDLAGPRLPWPSGETIYDRLRDELSPAARRAIFAPWDSFESMWAAA